MNTEPCTHQSSTLPRSMKTACQPHPKFPSAHAQFRLELPVAAQCPNHNLIAKLLKVYQRCRYTFFESGKGLGRCRYKHRARPLSRLEESLGECIRHSGYFSGGKIFVSSDFLASSWKIFVVAVL